MDPSIWLPFLLGIAVLLPLVSFAVILIAGPRLGKAGEFAGHIAVSAILGSLILSLISLGVWLYWHMPAEASHHGGDHAVAAAHAQPSSSDSDASDRDAEHGDAHHGAAPTAYSGEWYLLGQFGELRLAIGYYIDALTVCMFCMVTLIATCIHFYSTGYMHEELHDVTDHEVTLDDGEHLIRPGRYHRFFQSLSLFCFSMLGLVVSGNIAMTFIFWELVGICSYFLIGFYIERRSASTAANKAFIVNRIGDFGMIVGLMAIWASLGTFSFGDQADGSPGLFRLVRPSGESHPLGEAHAFELTVPDGMVLQSAREEVARIVSSFDAGNSRDVIESAVAREIPSWRDPQQSGVSGGYGYWLLIIAGLGIFCGCVGKSAQFPIHVWLPDAMEGPTPVSALVHSATMVAAGVFLVARFFPMFTPEVLLVIAITGAITLFMAATIAITATDIKRVLAYSTVSQLGYMMMALGVGGWLAGVMHLLTHAFFKSLLFMCSGSVIHAVHTNEMPLMGGLRKKMPWTAYTMLVGCLAIAGAGIPFVVGLSGYYSKDAILEQALLFKQTNPGLGSVFFFAAAGGASITAFYMFRLWFLTFAGKPRDEHRYEHAHESPKVMYIPLVILAVFAVGVAWTALEAITGAVLALILVFGLVMARRLRNGGGESIRSFLPKWSIAPLGISALVLLVGLMWLAQKEVTLSNVLEQARPAGTLPDQAATLVAMTWPNEHDSHAPAIKTPATITAFSTAIAGFLLAVILYGWRKLSPEDVRQQFPRLYRFLLNKWWFDELYEILFVKPTLAVSRIVAFVDRGLIDWFIDGSARAVRWFSSIWDQIADRLIVDGLANLVARRTYAMGASLRQVQTGRLRQYVMFIVVGTVAVFILVSFFWNYSLAR